MLRKPKCSIRMIVWALLLASASSQIAWAQAPAADSPAGTYLWYPEAGGPKSDLDCRNLVARVQPTKEKAEMSLWGTIPQNDPAAGTFYLILTQTRMEPTYAAEGDYDFGEVRLGVTQNGATPFELTPDDHPEIVIKGSVIVRPDSDIVTVTLKGIPLDEGTTDRTVYYCRFEDSGIET